MIQLIKKLKVSKSELAQSQDKPTNVLKAMETNIRKKEQKLEKALREVQSPTMPVVFWEEKSSEENTIMYAKNKQEIIFATTIYSMGVTKVAIEKGKDLLNDEHLENNPLYVVPAKLFFDNDVELRDLNGYVIPKGTGNVYVPTNNSSAYWFPQAYHNANIEAIIKEEPLKTIENVQIREFESIQEYGRYEGVNNVLSRGLNGTEKAGVAALATQNEFYQRVFETSKKRGINISTITRYFNEGKTLKPSVWNDGMLGTIPEKFSYDLSKGERILEVLDRKNFSDLVKKERYLIGAFVRIRQTITRNLGEESSFDKALEVLNALDGTQVEAINNITIDKEDSIYSILYDELSKLQIAA